MSRPSSAPTRRPGAQSSSPGPSSDVTLKQISVLPRLLQWVEHDAPRQSPQGFSVTCRVPTRAEQRVEYTIVAEVTFHKKGIYAVYITGRGGQEIPARDNEDRFFNADRLETMTLAFEHFSGPLLPEFNVRFERVGNLPPTIDEAIDKAKDAAAVVTSEIEEKGGGDAKPR